MKINWLTIILLLIVNIIVYGAIKPEGVDASSENVVIYQLSGAVSGVANREIVLLYNSSSHDINVTDWCIKYSSSSDGSGFSKCITTSETKTELWLTSGGFVSFATSELVANSSGFTPDFVFSSGMSHTSGHLRLLNQDKIEIDKVGWGLASSPEGVAATAHDAGLVLSRNLDNTVIDTDNNLLDFSSKPILSPIVSGIFEQEIVVDVCENIDGVQLELPQGYLVWDDEGCYFDVCPNIDELQKDLAEFYYIDENGNCLLVPLEDRQLFITELLPNVGGGDEGLEFVELYNPNADVIDLKGYRLQVGPSFTKQYVFENGFIAPGSYAHFSGTITKIILPNTSGIQMRLVAPAGNVVSETEIYSDANDNVSWALVEDQWIYTNQITPGSPNKPYLEPAESEVLGVTAVLAPCPAGKYRNPETNRCRSAETAVSQLIPCAEDEYRNPETNRCRKASSLSSLTTCPEGQERNPETNRCRKISVLGSSVDEIPTVTDVSVQNTAGHINWGVISASLVSTLAYLVYEWRSELGQKLFLVKLRFAKFVR